MDWLWEHITTARDKSWKWFVEHAHSRHALAWLAVVAFTDAIFSPLVPEAFVAALMIARPERWKLYIPVATLSTVAGAAVGYWIGNFLFHLFGEPILQLYGLHGAFMQAQQLLRGHVFVAMTLASFTPIPDKVFIYAGGFLGVHFIPYIVGYTVGRGARIAIVAYLAGKYGANILSVANKYFFYVALVVLALFAYYGMVHFHVFGL